MSERLTLSVAETAASLGIGRNRAYDLVARGEIPSLRIGRTIRVPLEPLREWVQKQTNNKR